MNGRIFHRWMTYSKNDGRIFHGWMTYCKNDGRIFHRWMTFRKMMDGFFTDEWHIVKMIDRFFQGWMTYRIMDGFFMDEWHIPKWWMDFSWMNDLSQNDGQITGSARIVIISYKGRCQRHPEGGFQNGLSFPQILNNPLGMFLAPSLNIILQFYLLRLFRIFWQTTSKKNSPVVCFILEARISHTFK